MDGWMPPLTDLGLKPGTRCWSHVLSVRVHLVGRYVDLSLRDYLSSDAFDSLGGALALRIRILVGEHVVSAEIVNLDHSLTNRLKLRMDAHRGAAS